MLLASWLLRTRMMHLLLPKAMALVCIRSVSLREVLSNTSGELPQLLLCFSFEERGDFQADLRNES